MPDFILNGQAHGDVASTLMANNFDAGALRPWLGANGRTYVTVNNNGKPENRLVNNATATLRQDDWKLLDEAIIKTAKPRLRAWGDLVSSGLVYNIPNGLSKTVFEYEDMSDITAAEISMDGVRESLRDRPIFDLKSLPLPIIHKDFSYSARQLAASRNGGSPLDTATAELAARRVSEKVESLLLGLESYEYGGGTVYGYLNFDHALTKSMTTPTTSNQSVVLNEILAMKAQSQAAYYYGPWFCYCAPSWDSYMDGDYSTNYGGKTLRDRIADIEGIDRPITLDYLTTKKLVLVQKTSDVVRAVKGMDINTLQWESHGGMQINFKVMAIMVPQMRADQADNTGLVVGTYT